MKVAAAKRTKSSNSAPSLLAFSIKGLHGSQDLRLTFPDFCSIYLADNGSGKTTALFVLQSVLKGNFAALRRFTFSEIIISFADHEDINITPSDIAPRRFREGMAELFRRSRITSAQADYLYQLVLNAPLSRVREDPVFRNFTERSGTSSFVMYERLKRYLDGPPGGLFGAPGEEFRTRSKTLQNMLKEQFSHKVVYLPTYRRIERDLELGAGSDPKIDVDYEDLHFGMRDVSRKITTISERVRNHAVESYGRTSGQMLSQLVETPSISADMREAVLSVEDVETVLGRVGQSISAENSKKILDAVKDRSIIKNTYLTLFVYELIKSYQAMSDLDLALRTFAEVCNGYLIDKKLEYDNVRASLTLKSQRSGNSLELEMLSSGEKQILGMMAEVYLGEEDSYAVIFDEPELSLSVEWQKKILVDITRAKKCALLVAATHSPFVFSNDLNKYVRTLKVQHT